MDKNIAQEIINEGLLAGASFVELFEEETRHSSLTLKDKAIESATAGTNYGIGLRLLYGTEVLYAFTSDNSRNSLLQMIKALTFGREPKPFGKPLSFLPQKDIWDYSINNFKDPRILGQAAKIDYLKLADITARSVSSKIVQVSASIIDSCSKISIHNSEGLDIETNQARCRANVYVTAEDGSERHVAHESPGALGGYEFLETISFEELARESAERALRILNAGYIDGGKMPVVMGNAFGGVIFHEACGHPLETESIRRNASPFCGKLGEQIAHPCLSAIDDGTIPNSWGSLKIDDEGYPTQKTVLIENGILKSYLSDRIGAEELGIPRTGSGRRESYKYAPVSRMRNTFIAKGNSSKEEMISSIENGLYAIKMAGGSVNPATGEFNFAVEEGYAIRNGKLAEPVRGATLIGKGHEILPKISMVGDDLELAAGMCGASSGAVPVTVGQPTLKVDQILVGGR